MPYIKETYREDYDAAIREWLIPDLNHAEHFCHQSKAGHLTYIITELLQAAYFDHDDYSFDRLSDCIKILECAKLEFYRKALAPYEDIKAKENGEVYADVTPGNR